MPNPQINKIEYGLSMLAYAVQTAESDDGVPTYAAPVMMPGARSMALSPQGDAQSLYADNVAYLVARANGGYDGTVDVVRLLESFLADCLGEKTDTAENSAVRYETTELNTKTFALLGQFDGDFKNKRFILYHCSASRPDFKGNTTESGGPDFGASTQSFAITATGGRNKLVKATLTDDGSSAYQNWFQSVYLPAGYTGS